MVSLTAVALQHQVLRSPGRSQVSVQGDPLLSPPYYPGPDPHKIFQCYSSAAFDPWLQKLYSPSN